MRLIGWLDLVRGRRLGVALLVAAAMAAAALPGHALDPARGVEQHRHVARPQTEGAHPTDTIIQTPDGSLARDVGQGDQVDAAHGKLLLAFSALGIVSLLWLAHHIRLRQVSERLERRLQERLAERERIARELHDALLQGVQGLVLKFQSASDDVPAGTPARRSLEEALERAEEMMVEARDRVRSLRAASCGDLATALADVAQRVALDRCVSIQLVTEGAPRRVHALVVDEIERIVTEALFNAYGHAQAGSITIEVAYDARQLGVRVRDDGVGIEQAVLDNGCRDGHFGLAGMRERASKINGQLVIRSRPGAGTEVEITAPASAAYDVRRPAWLPSWSRPLLAGAAE